MSEQRRLIEVNLPPVLRRREGLVEVSAQSAREKSIRHGHISTLHIWWAWKRKRLRRPLAACRAAVFATLMDAPEDFVAVPEREDVQRVEIRTQLPWERWYDFYGDVLDPLMSVGAEIEIALQLAAEAEQEMASSLIERLRDSLGKYDYHAELNAGQSG